MRHIRLVTVLMVIVIEINRGRNIIMKNIQSTEEAKKEILKKIAEKLTMDSKNVVNALRHANHSSAHGSHGARYH